MLKRLYIDNVRSFSNFTFQPGRVAALVGPNGGGKSSVYRVLGALQEFLVLGHDAHQVFNGSRTRWIDRSEQRIELDVQGANGASYSYLLVLGSTPDGKQVAVQQEQLKADGKVVYRLEAGEVQLFGDAPTESPLARFPFGSARSYLPLLEERPDNQLLMAFRRWMAEVKIFALMPQLMHVASDNEEGFLRRDGSNFVSWYRVLAQEQPQVRQALLADLAPVIPGLSEIRLIGGTGSARKVMQLECKLGDGANPYSLNVLELSDGQRALLVLYAIRHMIAERASLVVFDEPDNFVAYEEIQPWISGMREAVLKGKGTLLVISHHPEVIDYLAPDQVLRFWRDEGGPTRVDEPEVDLDTGLTASEAVRLESL